jgi:pimeloyl-ACP methyl ester carboxylesterase
MSDAIRRHRPSADLQALRHNAVMTSLRHRQLRVAGLSIHVVEGGTGHKPAVLFLHGWPQSSAAFESVMKLLCRDLRVVAIDLPGIGGSKTPAPLNTKRALADYVRDVVRALDLHPLTLVGHDMGGQVAYAYLRLYPDDVERVVIMNIAIPGVEPWSEVIRNPNIWHFGFHAVPGLPEKLVTGKESAYFRFFFDRIAARPGAIDAGAQKEYVRAYSRPSALHVGFEWYRAFKQDLRDNKRFRMAVTRPVLYLRGAKDPGLELDRYVQGLSEAGLRDVTGCVIANSGHFVADEQPRRLAMVLREFIFAGRSG